MGKVIDIAVARIKKQLVERAEAIKELIKEADALDRPIKDQEPGFIGRILDLQVKLLDKKDKDDDR